MPMYAKKRTKLDAELKNLAAMPDDAINFSDIPEQDSTDWLNAEVVFPKSKTPVSIRFDDDILDWFKKQGKGYQSRMNAVLRVYVEAHREKRN